MSTQTIPYHIVDAFATGPFTGNQAPVVITSTPLSSELMQKMAAEFNAESAFVSPREEDDPSTYNLKWFTPDYEADICGHATLGASHVLFDQPQNKDVRTLTFHTLSGVMKASKTDNGMVELDFPADDLVEQQGDVRAKIEKAAIASVRGQGRVKGVQLGRWYLTIELEMDKNVNLADVEVLPNELLGLPGQGTILTTESSHSEGARFHSRFFTPGKAIVEDSTTGSAHCSLGVVYAPRFDAIEKPLTATQGGRRRGRITMVWDGKAGKDGGRMKLRGNTVTVARGELYV